MYSCAHVLSRVWVRPCCRVQSLTIPELLQNKWTMCSLFIFKIYLFLFIFTSSSFVIYSAFCLLALFQLSMFLEEEWNITFFFLILRSSFFLPCLLLSVFPPSFCLLTSCLFLSYYHYSLNSLLLFYGKNIISNFTKDSRL